MSREIKNEVINRLREEEQHLDRLETMTEDTEGKKFASKAKVGLSYLIKYLNYREHETESITTLNFVIEELERNLPKLGHPNYSLEFTARLYTWSSLVAVRDYLEQAKLGPIDQKII